MDGRVFQGVFRPKGRCIYMVTSQQVSAGNPQHSTITHHPTPITQHQSPIIHVVVAEFLS